MAGANLLHRPAPGRRLLRAGIPVAGIVAGGTAALALAVLILQPPRDDLVLLALYLTVSGGLSLGIGFVGLSLLGRFGTGGLRARIAFGQLLVIAIAFVNIVMTALLMFLSPHDLGLLGSLLLFAAVMAIVFALALADSIASAVAGVTGAARRMADGDLSARAPVTTRDEIGALALSFNAMAAQLERSLRDRYDAEQARRDLVAAVSHDLRTPLSSIRAMVEAINDGVVADADTVERYLRTIQHETERLGRLIDDLFELSQIDAGALRLRLERGSLHDLISDTVRSLGPPAERKGVRLVGAVDQTLPAVWIDPARIQRVLDNLIGNAIRHTPAGGTVAVRAIELDDHVEVAVSDTGEGIPEDELPRVFDRFHRGEKSRTRDGSGAGLGLTIARGIVAAHGGSIWAESGASAGTTFHFTLQLA